MSAKELDGRWPLPLKHFTGAPVRLLGITVFFDFDWFQLFGHERATFPNGQSLAKRVRTDCPIGKNPAVLLTDRGDAEEIPIETSTFYVAVVKIRDYKELAIGNAADSYLAQKANIRLTKTSKLHEYDWTEDELDEFYHSNLKPEAVVRWARREASRSNALQNAASDSAVDARVNMPNSDHATAVSGDDLAGSCSQVEPTIIELAQTMKASGETAERLLRVVNMIEPGAVVTVAVAERLRKRQEQLKLFRDRLADADGWIEGDWEKFFRTNIWIFGHGLAYRFLTEIQKQPHYGGTRVDGTDYQRGDMLMSTVAAKRFTVLVDIKRPDSDLVEEPKYRNKVYLLGKDLIGGVAQLQSNCRTWVIDGSRQDDNVELLAREQIFTCEPKGILVIGHCAQLKLTPMLHTFELFRRNLHNPEVITFDELYQRAEYLVNEEA